MNEQQVGYDLDVAKMEVDALVILAVECGFKLAEDELILRYRERTNRQIAILAAGIDWTAEDVEDAQQEAYSWLKVAVQTYDTDEIGKPGGCSFGTFAHQVVERRCLDFAKHIRCVEHHFDRAVAVVKCLDESSEHQEFSSAADKASESASAAELHEFMTALRQAMQELNHTQHRIWELRTRGASFPDTATELCISPHAVRRRWNKVKAFLKTRLAGFA